MILYKTFWSFNDRVKARKMNIDRDKVCGNIQPNSLHEAAKHPILHDKKLYYYYSTSTSIK